jgi:hypothetical protein
VRHLAPKIENDGPGLNDLAAKLVRNVASRNPLTAAIYEELQPEVDGALKNALGNQHVDLSVVHEVATRAHKIAKNAAGKVRHE